MISDMCNKAGLQRKTNHSLWATAAMALFEPNAPEKVIQEHRSLEALHLYKCSTAGMDYQKATHPVSAPEMCPSTDITTGSNSSLIGLKIGSMTGLYNQHILWNPPIASQPPTTEAAMLMLSAREIEEVFSDF